HCLTLGDRLCAAMTIAPNIVVVRARLRCPDRSQARFILKRSEFITTLTTTHINSNTRVRFVCCARYDVLLLRLRVMLRRTFCDLAEATPPPPKSRFCSPPMSLRKFCMKFRERYLRAKRDQRNRFAGSMYVLYKTPRGGLGG